MRILFVCTGNMCRSPMAEGLARAVIDREYPETRERFDFSSAGVAALEGNVPAREAVEVMMERGIDISGHRARNVTRRILEASDLVLTMEGAQRKRVEEMTGGVAPPVFLLLELGEAGTEERDGLWARDASRYEVLDPIGMSADEYRYVAAIMEGPIENILRLLGSGLET
ncbi:MAG: low molecular weight protein arginine phosphatase [Actinobacteria bacterium]|nr:low molecular weight protein arginine phosphatase [Actinomycetota bacterium]